jgi:polysaccharide biosynthesis protein PslL
VVLPPTAELVASFDSDTPPLPAEVAPAPRTSKSGRLLHLDVAKGISILLVVLGHSRVLHGPTKANLVLGTIRMPLFFFVSGLFFKHRKDLGRLAHEKADALLKPFFVTLGALGIVKVLSGAAPALSYYGMLAYGNGKTIDWVPMWFLPHLWAVFIVSWLLMKATGFEKRSAIGRGALLTALLVLGFFTIRLFWKSHVPFMGKMHEIPGLPFTLDVVLLTSFFFLLGFSFQDRVRSMAFRALWFLPVLAVFVTLHVLFNDSIDFNTRRYDSLPISTLAAFCGVFLVLSVATLLSRVRAIAGVIAYVGSMSLFVLIFHYPIQSMAHTLFDAWWGPRLALNSALAYLIGVGVPLMIGMAIKRSRVLAPLYLPISRRPVIRVAPSPLAPALGWSRVPVAKNYVERSASSE